MPSLTPAFGVGQAEHRNCRAGEILPKSTGHFRASGLRSLQGSGKRNRMQQEEPMRQALWFCAAAVGMCAVAAPASAEEAPKYGGTLTYMIPAESPPSFDAQREETFATIHSAAIPKGSC